MPRGRSLLTSRKVLITAGPTREYWDPVRFISNASSGAMGIALAREARKRGASVTLVLGPIPGPLPDAKAIGRIVSVISARDMDVAVQKHLAGTDVFVGAAAVSDYRPAEPSRQKIKDKADRVSVVLQRNPDIIARVSRPGSKRPTLVVGFALETQSMLRLAQGKLERKGMDWIIANRTENMGSAHATVTLLHRSGETVAFKTMPKPKLAEKIWHTLLTRQTPL